jgi:hypothetical protein
MRGWWMAGLVAAALAGGCGREWEWLTGGSAAPRIRIAERRVLVMAFSDPMLHAQYPTLEREMAAAVLSRLAAELRTTDFVPPQRVEVWKQQHPGWRRMQPAEIARALESELLIDLTITDFRTREPGSGGVVMQGRLTLEPAIVQAVGDAVLWRSAPQTSIWPIQAPQTSFDVSDARVTARVVAIAADRVADDLLSHLTE